MTTFAVRTELSCVLIFVTGQARDIQPHEGPRQVLYRDQLAGGRRDMPGIVALIALQTRVAPLEGIPRRAVIELVL